MANYDEIKPGKTAVKIPSSTKKTFIRASGGDLLISSDETFDRKKAMPLLRDEAHPMPAGQEWWVTSVYGTGTLKRMDLE